MSYREYEDPDVLAARLARDQAWAAGQRDRDAAEETRHTGLDHGAHHAPAPRRTRCNCGCEEASAGDSSPGPAGNPYDVLRRLNANRRDPAAVREEARDAAVAEHAEPRLDGHEALRRLSASGNPDGTRLSGSAAREIIRHTEFRGELWPG